MSLSSVIFIDRYPSLDIHGYDRETARVAINDFIRDNMTMKNKIIVIIHGVGSGVLIETTKKVLTHNRNVIDFKRYYNNTGCTIVELNL